VFAQAGVRARNSGVLFFAHQFGQASNLGAGIGKQGEKMECYCANIKRMHFDAQGIPALNPSQI
jgi:hypothetical protein